MPASRQLGYDGSEAKRAWEAPIVAALPIRATASSWGFKWDSGWGGGKRDSVGHRPPNQQIEVAPIQQAGARLSCTPNQRNWESPVVKALPVRATAAGWGTKFDTYMALDRSGSIGHLPPSLPAQNATVGGTRARFSGKPDRRGWEAPTVKALSLRDTASSWGFKWDSGWGGEKSATIGHLPPEHPAKEALVQISTMTISGQFDRRVWEAPMVNALPVGATASSWGIKWDLYMGGGKMATGPQSPPQHQPKITSTGGVVVRALHGPVQRNWEAPTVTALSFRFTAITVD